MTKHIVVLEITSDELTDGQVAVAVIKNIQTSKWVGQYDLANASAETRLISVGEVKYDDLH